MALEKYQQLILTGLEREIKKIDQSHLLGQATRYALLNGGKRVRPAIVLMVAEALASDSIIPYEEIISAALAIEFFHTASLVADDLPCMDDDDQRRNKPSVHKVYGESLALLTSYGLIAAGFSSIADTANKITASSLHYASKGASLGVLAMENAAYNTGLKGATGGQLLDLFPPDLSLSVLCELIQKKTSSLFEISFVFGWLFGGGSVTLLPEVKKAASHFGLAFQIADDLEDMVQDQRIGRKVNVANVCGEIKAKKILFEQLSYFQNSLKILKIDSPSLLFLSQVQA